MGLGPTFLIAESDPDAKAFYSTVWYNSMKMLSTEQFNNSFRMPKKHFDDLVSLLEYFSGQINIMKKTAMFIYYTLQVSTFREIRLLFSIPKSTVNKYIDEVALIMYTLARRDIKFPSTK